MLNKNLLRYDIRNQKIFPRFLDTQNRVWQKISGELALIYENGSGHSREELAELVQPILNNARSPLTAKGLNKLLLDRCVFQEANGEFESFRMKVFTTAAQKFRQQQTGGQQPSDLPLSGTNNLKKPSDLPLSGTNNLEMFRQVVAQSLDMDPDSLTKRLYGDLPNRQLLLSFKPISPEQLLHRYNMAQAQGLFFSADSLLIEMEEPAIGVRRKFFHHLNYFHILAHISQKRSGQFSIQVYGPLNLFTNNRKYGMQLARFIPSVCALKRWHIQANLVMDNAEHVTLELDHDTGLKSHFAQTSTYVPEEFERFAQQFESLKKSSNTKKTGQGTGGWKIKNNTALLDMGGQEWIVPDFSFRHDSGQVVHLELFHRWHATQLMRRLQNLQKQDKPLALGVDRFLAKNVQTKAILEQSEWYQQHGFTFNSFPPVKRILDCLNGFL